MKEINPLTLFRLSVLGPIVTTARRTPGWPDSRRWRATSATCPDSAAWAPRRPNLMRCFITELGAL